MTKEQLVEETSKGNWSSVLGLGVLGVASSIGVVPMLVMALAGLGVGIVLILYFLPLLLAGIVSGAVFYLGYKFADLRGLKLIGSTLLAGVGSLLLFSYTKITLWGVSSNVASQGVLDFLFGVPDAMVKILQLILGIAVLGFVLMSLLVIKSVGLKGIGDAIAGILAAMTTGVIVSSYFNLRIPGLSEGISTQLGSMMAPSIIAFVIGTVVIYIFWRYN